jgi:hypothetical protein
MMASIKDLMFSNIHFTDDKSWRHMKLFKEEHKLLTLFRTCTRQFRIKSDQKSFHFMKLIDMLNFKNSNGDSFALEPLTTTCCISILIKYEIYWVIFVSTWCLFAKGYEKIVLNLNIYYLYFRNCEVRMCKQIKIISFELYVR